jgi:tripartite-type tricarboxylate transporter receptor subunit TctC
MNRRALLQASAAVLCGAPLRLVAADPDFPSRPIRIVVPFNAGNQLDVFARLLGERLAPVLGQPIVVDNRPGMSGNIATDVVAKSAPDGHTLLLSGVLITLLPLTFGPRAVDPVKELAPITRLSQQPLLIVANPALGVSSLEGLIARARREPGRIAYGTSGVGTAQHLMMTMLTQQAGIELFHVPYSNFSQLMGDVIGGSIPLIVTFTGTVDPHLKSGRLKALAHSGGQASPLLPDVPTIAESGFPGFEVQTWGGVLAPAGTPRPIVERLHREIVRIMRLPEVRDVFVGQGAEPVGNTPDAFAAEIRASIARWAPVIKAAGIRAE